MIKYFIKTATYEAEFRTRAEAESFQSEKGGILGVKEEFETGNEDDIKTEVFILEGEGAVDAVSEIQSIVNSGTVDLFLDTYADALLRIDTFLNN